jgi:outer membrane cobalamin receptor
MRVLSALSAPACLALISVTFAGDPAKEPVLTEQVTVTASRLSDEPDDADRVPANVTVISREEIERLGAVDLADLLALEAGAVFYDQTGNGVQTTFDLRGFTNGSGTRVFLDGAPLNDAVNNTSALELVPLEALERVEITRGSAAALAGGGSEAGVINLVTRRGEKLNGNVSLALGTFDSSEYGGHLSHAAGPVDFLISGKRRETDGFRDNADGDLRRLSAGVGFDLGGERRLELTLLDSESDYGNPGALTKPTNGSVWRR